MRLLPPGVPPLVRRSLLAALLAGSLGACGGGGGDGGDPTSGALMVFPADPADDGYFRSNGTIAPDSPYLISVGANGVAFLDGYVRFTHPAELSALAAEGRVTGVLLSLYSRGPGGTGTVEVEHPQIYVQHTDFGAVIDAADYGNTGAFIPDGVIQWGNGTPLLFQLDVTDEVLADVAGGYTDIYLLSTGATGDDSFWHVEDVDGAPGLTAPHLVVDYGP
jgi:hypothetical protein